MKISHPLSNRSTLILAISGCIALIGAGLLLVHNQHFVFYHAASYTRVSLALVALGFPFALTIIRKSKVFSEYLAKKYPTDWVRNWLCAPALSIFIIAIFCAAPLGWTLTLSKATGDTIKVMHASAAKVYAYSPSKRCDQMAELQFRGFVKQTCLEGLYPMDTMRNGQILDVTVLGFSYGFVIISIADSQKEGASTTETALDAGSEPQPH